MNRGFSRGQIIFLLGLIIVGAFLTTIVDWRISLPAAIVAVAICFFYFWPRIGLYLITFLYPLTYLEVVYHSINAPYVDVLAMIVFVGWLARSLVDHASGRSKMTWSKFPGLAVFAIFIISAALSLVNAPDMLVSIKYLLRPLSFFYLMFVVLPYNLIDNRATLKKVMMIFYILGLTVAAMGFVSLFVTDQSGFFRRAVPIALGNIRPLGWNHNLIAEVLVAVIPFGAWLSWQAQSKKAGRWLMLGVALMIAVTLLTFSRTGWITLFVELIILLAVRYRHYWKKVLAYSAFIGLVLSPIFIYMYLFSTSYIAESSNFHRLYLTTIAWQSWLDHPVIGNGAGTFTSLVASDPIFLYEFGGVEESHGVIQKLLAEFGLLGLVTFGLLLSWVIWQIVKAYWRARRHHQEYADVIIVCLMVAVGAIVFQLFQTSYFVSKMWYPLGVALAATKFVYAKKA